MSKSHLLLALALAAAPSALMAASATKEQLMVAPAAARHFTISSIAGKHGDVWSWSLPGGRTAYRMSMSMRGWITEDDEVVTAGTDGRPARIAIRGFTDNGDATEDYVLGANGLATWKTAASPA